MDGRALILGGGPAGCAAAIALAAAGERPLLVERTRETGDALCGGFLSWRSLETLAQLGIAADTLNRERVETVRLFAGRHRAEAPLPRPALAVSRRTLDTVMMARAREVAGVERGVTIRALEGGAARTGDGATLRAGALFLATGKHDVRGAARPQVDADPTLGLRIRLPAAPALDRLVGRAVELHLFASGYAGIARQEDGSVNVCMAVRRSCLTAAGDPARLLAVLGKECPALGERLAFATGTAAIDAVANVPYGWRLHDGTAGLFRLGDQAAVIPSLAGEGMGIALASGVMAARAFARGGAGAGATFQPAFARHVARPMRVAGAARHLAESAPASSLVAVLPAPLIGLVARLTRLPADLA